ncbi:MAG: tetratricopeptide repeat protein [Bacteroidetes bacterium]|nr:MAG: tetratricopeptide repeat protein [Bacteroidota bacterium]
MEHFNPRKHPVYRIMQRSVIIFLWILTAICANAQEEGILRPDSINSFLSAQSSPARIVQVVDSLEKIKKASYEAYLWAAEASYNLGKLYGQQRYLEKAHRIYPNDTRALPALYENYLALGNYPQALRLNKLILAQAELGKYYAKRPVLHLVHMEYGIKQSSNDSLYAPLHYAQIGVGIRVNQIAWMHAISYLKQNSILGSTSQYQYYSALAIPLKNNWTVSPACHVLYVNITNEIPIADSSILSSTAFVVALQVSKQYKNFKLELGATQGNMNNENQLQIQPAITYYPFSNQKVLLQVAGTYFTEKDAATGMVQLGARPIPSLQVIGNYLYGDVRNFAEQNGYLINNSFDETNQRYGLITNYNFTPSITIYGVFQLEQKTEYFSRINYNYATGLLGVKKVF